METLAPYLIVLTVPILFGVPLALNLCSDLRHANKKFLEIRLGAKVKIQRRSLFSQKLLTLDFLNSVSTTFILSLLVKEDSNFYSHRGFDWKEIFRSAYITITQHKLKGGSSISQQTVKLLCYEVRQPSKIFVRFKIVYRKLFEALATISLERSFSKNEILSIYLQMIEFSTATIGLEDSSMVIFRKSYTKLSVSESLFLVSLLPKPGRFRQRRVMKGPANMLFFRDIYESSLIVVKALIYLRGRRDLLCSSKFKVSQTPELPDISEKSLILAATRVITATRQAQRTYRRTPVARIPSYYSFLEPEQRETLACLFGTRQVFSKKNLACGPEAFLQKTEWARSAIGLTTLIEGYHDKDQGNAFASYDKGQSNGTNLLTSALVATENVASLAKDSDIECIVAGDSNLSLNFYRFPLGRPIDDIILLISDANHSKMEKTIKRAYRDNGNINISLVSVSQKVFSDRLAVAQKRQIGKAVCMFQSPVDEFFYQANDLLRGIFKTWRKVMDLKILADVIGWDTLLKQCAKIDDQSDRNNLFAIMLVLMQVSERPVPFRLIRKRFRPTPRAYSIFNISISNLLGDFPHC